MKGRPRSSAGNVQDSRSPRIRAKEVLKELRKIYPDPRSELNFNSEYELVTAVILSAQCTDKKVNEITPALFSKFSSFESLANARKGDVERIIRPINYYRTKARHIIETAAQVQRRFNGRIPHSRNELESLPGVGRKTANVVLGELGIEKTIPVDTHVFRVARRLGFSKREKPHEVEEDIRDLFDPKDWYHLHHWLIFHGRRVCKAQRPACGSCSLSRLCPSKSSWT